VSRARTDSLSLPKGGLGIDVNATATIPRGSQEGESIGQRFVVRIDSVDGGQGRVVRSTDHFDRYISYIVDRAAAIGPTCVRAVSGFWEASATGATLMLRRSNSERRS